MTIGKARFKFELESDVLAADYLYQSEIQNEMTEEEWHLAAKLLKKVNKVFKKAEKRLDQLGESKMTTYEMKIQLIRHIKNLKNAAEYTIMDLGELKYNCIENPTENDKQEIIIAVRSELKKIHTLKNECLKLLSDLMPE